MSVNDVTSEILAPALQVKRLQKQEPNQKLWRRSQANKNRCVGIFKRRDILFNRLHFPILIKFMLCDTSWTNAVHVFSFVALSFNLGSCCNRSDTKEGPTVRGNQYNYNRRVHEHGYHDNSGYRGQSMSSFLVSSCYNTIDLDKEILCA